MSVFVEQVRVKTTDDGGFAIMYDAAGDTFELKSESGYSAYIDLINSYQHTHDFSGIFAAIDKAEINLSLSKAKIIRALPS